MVKRFSRTKLKHVDDDGIELENRCPIDDELCDEYGARRHVLTAIRHCRHGEWNKHTDDPPCKNIEMRENKPAKSPKRKPVKKCKCK